MHEIDIELARELSVEAKTFVDREWTRVHDDLGESFDREPYVLTARRNGRIVGVARGWTGIRMGYLSELIVDGDLRGEGIGARLLSAFERLAAERGFCRLALVTEKGGGSQRFYQQHGWRPEAEMPDWYFGRTFVTMRKDIDKPD
jgi:GNAT superfamily N-acetyltransferase